MVFDGQVHKLPAELRTIKTWVRSFRAVVLLGQTQLVLEDDKASATSVEE